MALFPKMGSQAGTGAIGSKGKDIGAPAIERYDTEELDAEILTWFRKNAGCRSYFDTHLTQACSHIGVVCSLSEVQRAF